jgi:type IV secretory pathway TraG/TraD family ATPase VirD4
MEFLEIYGDILQFIKDNPMPVFLMSGMLTLNLSIPYTEKKRMCMKPEEQIHQQNKLPDKSWLSKKAEGVIIGKVRTGEYVRVPVKNNEIYNGLIVGGAGSGKTSTLLMCTQLANSVSDHPFTTIIVDPKREQYRTVPGKNNLCLDPTDRSTWGYDPYYKLNSLPHASADIQIEEFSRISRALIVEKDPKSSYWVNNARDLLTGLLMVYYAKGTILIDTKICQRKPSLILSPKPIKKNRPRCYII